MKTRQVFVVISRDTGEPLEGHITTTMSPALQDMYRNAKEVTLVQGVLVYQSPNDVE